jgi:hypothetical protein
VQVQPVVLRSKIRRTTLASSATTWSVKIVKIVNLRRRNKSK